MIARAVGVCAGPAKARRLLYLLGAAAVAVAVGLVLWIGAATPAGASSVVKLNAGAAGACPVTVSGNCSYAEVSAALQSAINGGTASWSTDLAGLPAGGMDLAGATLTEDSASQSLVLAGTVSVGGNDVPAQASASWAGGVSSPELALAIKPAASSLSALNGVWSSAADPQLTGALLISSPDPSYVFDPSTLPAVSSQPDFYSGYTSHALGSGVSLVAGVDVAATVDPALQNVLHYLGVGTTATISGKLSNTLAPVLAGSAADANDKAGLDLMLQSTTSGSGLPSWINSRTSSVEFKLASAGTPPATKAAVTWSDSLQTTIDNQPNTFTGSFAYDPTADAGSTLTAGYEVASANTFNAPFGLGSLQLSDTKLALSLTLGSPKVFSGDLSSTVTAGSDSFGITAHLDNNGGVNGDLSVTGPVSVADMVALGNQLAGTNVTAGTGSVGNDLALTGAEFSFSKTASSPAELKFAATASATFRGATANVLVSLKKSGTDPAKLLIGLHAANVNFSQLADQTSDTFSGLTFPNVDVFVSTGYLTDGKPTDVPWSDLLPAEQTFFTSVYGTAPATVSFGPNLSFAGTMTLPDSVAGPLGVTEPIQLSGDLGFGLNTLGDATAPKLGGTLTATLPAVSAGLPSWLSGVGPWTATISADSNHNVQLSVDGKLTAHVEGVDYPVSISGAIAKQGSDLSFTLTGTITHNFTNLFGLSTLEADNPSISLSINHSATGTTFTGSLSTDVVIGSNPGYRLHAVADISNADGTSAALTLTSVDSTATVSIADVATFFGAGTSDLPTLPFSVTLNSLQARAALTSGGGSTSVSVDVVADTTAKFGNASLDSQQLLSINKPASGKVSVIVGFKPTKSISLSDIVGQDHLPNGVDFTFPSFALVAAHPAASLTYADLLPAEQDFFQPFCGDAGSACHDKLTIADGVSVVSATTLPDQLTKLTAQLGGSPTAPVLVTGTIPFSSTAPFSLKVQLPSIPATGPDFYAGGQLAIDISTDGHSSIGLSIDGTMTFNVPKGSSVSNATDCASESGVWRTRKGGGSPACFDQVPFTLSAGISITDTGASITLTGGLDPSYRWVDPMGQKWLSLNRATIQFGIQVGESVQFSLGFDIAATIAGHDFSGSILASLVVGPPLGLDPNLEGVRIASGSGLSAQDLVSLANLTGANLSLQNAKLPNIAVRNVLLSFSQVADPQLCLAQGVHIAGDLYINPAADAQTVDSADCGNDNSPAVDRTQICKDDSAKGCLAGVDVAISDSGVHASGVLGAFNAGPLKFGGATVDFQISPTAQRLLIAGSMSIQDFASGRVDLLISPTAAHFRGAVQLFGSGLDAYVDGSAAVNINNLSDLQNIANFNITAVLKSDWLNQAGVALSGTLSKLRPAVQAVSAVVQDINNGDVLGAMFEIPTKAAQLGVSLPAPFGDAFASVSSTLSKIKSGLDTLGHPFSYALNSVLNGFTLSFPGIPGIEIPQTCITTEQDGQCWTTPPWHTIFGTVPGIPGFTVGPTCITTTVDGICYSVPPITGVHIPGICNDLQNVIPGLTCDQNGIADDLLFPALKALLKSTIGYDIGNVSLSSALQSIDNALGSGQTFSVDCAEFQASATAGTSPSANVTLSANVNLFGSHLTPQISWDFAPNSDNVGTDITEILDSIIHPSTTTSGSCGLPADWNSDTNFPDVLGTGPQSTGGDTGTPVVLPPPPAMTASLADATINEGDGATLNGAVTPVPATTQTISIDWGDGTTSQTTTATDGSFTASHPYPNNLPAGQPSAQYLVTATGASLTATASLTVANVAPSHVIATPSAATVNEGDAITVTGSFVDPGADPHTVTFDWGDGDTSSRSLPVGTTTFTSPPHTYLDNNGTQDGYPLTVTVTDDDQASTSVTMTETVNNVAPNHIAITQLSAPGSSCPAAGCTLATPEQQAPTFKFTFTDPGPNDTVTAVIDWGDGTTNTIPLGTNRSLVLPHVWTEADTAQHPDGHFPITATVTDKDGGTGTGTGTETVTNVAPSQVTACLLGSIADAASSSPCPASATINEGDSVNLFGAFTDPSSADTHTVTIDWGPGWPTGERYQTLNLPVGTLGYSATRQYGDEGTYPVTVTVADDDAATTSTSSTLAVRNVAPTGVIDRHLAAPVQSAPAFLTQVNAVVPFSASSVDPGNDPLTATWNWQDATSKSTVHPGIAESTPENPHVAGQAITDTQSHAWAAACVYPMTFTSDDGDGGKTPDQADVVVTGTDHTWRGAGYWQGLYKNHPSSTLDCYLKITQRMSALFAGPASKVASAPVSLRTAADAASVLQPSSSDERLKLEREILTWWLGYANGAATYNQQIDTNHDGRPDTAFSAVLTTAEKLALNPAASQSQLRDERTMLAAIDGD